MKLYKYTNRFTNFEQIMIIAYPKAYSGPALYFAQVVLVS